MNSRLNLILLFACTMILFSCKKNIAMVEVINHTNCVQNIYEGSSNAGVFKGAIGSKQTKVLEYELDAEVVNKPFGLFSDPQNCTQAQGKSHSFYLQSNETVTVNIE